MCETGHVGAPLPCNIVKLVDVEEMNYFASNGEGEVRTGECSINGGGGGGACTVLVHGQIISVGSSIDFPG